MKLKLLPTLALAVSLAACGDTTGLDAADLAGTWTATVYEYTDNANAQNVVDIIQRDGASFQLVVEASGTASSLLDDGLGSTSSDSGTLDSTASMLTVGGVPFDATRDEDTLTLVYTESSFDFGAGSTPATLRIVMTRS